MVKGDAARLKRRARRQCLLAPAHRKRRIVPALQNVPHVELGLPMPYQIQIGHMPSPRSTTKGPGTFVVVLPPDRAATTQLHQHVGERALGYVVYLCLITPVIN